MIQRFWQQLIEPQCWASVLCRDLQLMLTDWLTNDPAWTRYNEFINLKHKLSPLAIYCHSASTFAAGGLYPDKDLSPFYQYALIYHNPLYIEAFATAPDRLAIMALKFKQTEHVFKRIHQPSMAVCVAAAQMNDDWIAYMEPRMARQVCEKLNIRKPYVQMKQKFY